MMRYERGYPKKIAIGEDGISVSDVESLILSLSYDLNIGENSKHYLMKYYTSVWQEYLDGHYEMTDERRNRLLEVDRMLWEKRDFMYMVYKQHIDRAVRMYKQGLHFPKSVSCHFEVDNNQNQRIDDRTCDLFDILCGEARNKKSNWGLIHDYWHITHIDDRVLQMTNKMAREVKANGLTKALHDLKERYTLAWQDVEIISGFVFTIYCDYGKC